MSSDFQKASEGDNRLEPLRSAISLEDRTEIIEGISYLIEKSRDHANSQEELLALLAARPLSQRGRRVLEQFIEKFHSTYLLTGELASYPSLFSSPFFRRQK